MILKDGKYQVLIAGSGFMGKKHGDVYKNLGNVEVVKIYDISKELGVEYADRYDCKWTDDLQEALLDTDIVDVCLPTLHHKDITLKALAAGRHVICEKPISLDVDEAEEMAAAAKLNKRIFMIAQVVRFWPEYAKLTDMIKKEEIKDILNITFSRYGAPPSWSVNKWMLSDKKSGGIIHDLIIHDVDYAVSLFGIPEWVFAKRTMLNSEYTAYVNIILGYKDTNVLIEGGFDMPNQYPYTTGFRLTTGDMALEYVNKNKKGLLKYDNVNADGIKLEYEDYNPYQKEIEYFLECISKNMEPEIGSSQDAVKLIKVLKNIEFSAINRKKIDVRI